MKVKPIPQNTLMAIHLMAQAYVPELKEEHIIQALSQFDANTHSQEPAEIALPRFLTYKEVASRLQITVRSVHNLIKQGQLERVKIGRSARVSETSFSDYCQQLIDTNHQPS